MQWTRFASIPARTPSLLSHETLDAYSGVGNPVRALHSDFVVVCQPLRCTTLSLTASLVSPYGLGEGERKFTESFAVQIGNESGRMSGSYHQACKAECSTRTELQKYVVLIFLILLCLLFFLLSAPQLLSQHLQFLFQFFFRPSLTPDTSPSSGSPVP